MDRFLGDPGDLGKLNVLVIEDVEADRVLIEHLLAAHFSVDFVTTAAACVEYFETKKPHCVVTDYRLGDTDGLAILNHLREAGSMRYVPMVMLTGHADPKLAAQAFRSGADDFLSKDDMTDQRLIYAIKAAILDKRLKEAMDAERESLQIRNLELEKRHKLMAEYFEDLSHTILTPLAVTQEFVSLVLDGVAGDINEEQGQFLALARGGCASIHKTIQRLFKVSSLAANPDALSWDHQDLCALLDHVVEDLRLESSEMDVEFVTQYDNRPIVFGERASLEQLIHLLLRRCLWYTTRGGTIRIHCDATEDPDLVRIKVTGNTRFLQVEALDDPMSWQINAALSGANASNFTSDLLPDRVVYTFDLVRYIDFAPNPDSTGIRPQAPVALH